MKSTVAILVLASLGTATTSSLRPYHDQLDRVGCRLAENQWDWGAMNRWCGTHRFCAYFDAAQGDKLATLQKETSFGTRQECLDGHDSQPKLTWIKGDASEIGKKRCHLARETHIPSLIEMICGTEVLCKLFGDKHGAGKENECLDLYERARAA